MAAKKILARALPAGFVLLAVISPLTSGARAAVPSDIRQVAADAETVPVGTSGDSADDPAIWVNPADPSRSTIIGNDKGDALEVYDLAGNRIQRIGTAHGNVDVRPGFPLGTGTVDIAAATKSGLRVYAINPSTRLLSDIGSVGTNGGEGLCMYHSASSGRFYVFQITREGQLQQWWLRDADADGRVDGQLVRSFSIGSEAEGCVADDELGHLYVSEEDVAIWKYGAEPNQGSARTLIDSAGASGHFVPDAEGLTLVYQQDGKGFLLASSQNVAQPTASYFTIYQREAPNAYVGAFRVVAGAGADGCSRTDGITAMAGNLGPAFPSGLFVCQDDDNTTPGGAGNQDFKLVRLEKILTGLEPPPPPGPDETPPDTLITSGPSGTVFGASATFTFSSTEAGSTFTCSLDGAPEAACASPVTYDDLSLGGHHFEVRATDAAGNPDPTAAARDWSRAEEPAGPITLAAVADAQVAQAGPGANYGAAQTMVADLDPLREAYVAFDVPATGQPIASAKLRLWATDSSNNGPRAYESDPDWTESTITWNNRPTRSTVALADLGAVTAGRYVEWDVSAVVTADGRHSFTVAADGTDGIYFSTKEATANRPQLLIQLADGPPPPDTTAPTATITSGPSGTVSSTTATFSFAANEPATFVCSLDGAPAAACTSPRSYSGLSSSTHHFEVTPTDTAGNTGAPAARDWTVDTSSPPPALNVITTIAGTGTRGSGGDGGPATSAQLNAPRTTDTDAAGNTYVADTENHRIRRISAAGIITTLAGNGTAGFSGDGGPATSARLNNPHGVVVDGAGNVYVADSANNRVRRIGTDGRISTVAGTGSTAFNGNGIPATQANLNHPKGVELAPDGSIYVGDANNQRVRRFVPGGLITTVAGSGVAGYSGDGGPATSARFRLPRNIAFGPDDSFYIADQENFVVRRVTPAGVITTVAGTGVAGFSGDGGPATSARLRRVDDVAVDSAGNIYIADEENRRIRRVDAFTGRISTFAGTGVSGFSGDGGPPASARLSGVRGVEVTPAGDVLIADTGNHRIRRVR